MLFVIHATDRKDGMPTRAKFYRNHRIHLDKAGDYEVDVVTAGTLIADDGETPCGSVFVIDAKGVIYWSYVSPVGVSPGADGVLEALESMAGQQAASQPAASASR